MADKDTHLLQILTLPKVTNVDSFGPSRYPLQYWDINNNGPLTINVPVGCLTCRSSCYTDINDTAVRSGYCRRCDRPANLKDRFIDVGLMNLLVKYNAEIEANGYSYIEYDADTNDIRFIKRRENLEGRLAELATADIMTNLNKKMTVLTEKNLVLNFPSIKGLFSDRIDKVIGEFKPEVITWCRGRLQLDEHFSALNLNFSSSPNKVLCFQLVDVHGKPLKLDYKNTHIHFLPKLRIFVMLVLEGVSPDRRLGIRVIDLNSISLGNQKLTVVATTNSIEGRVWYATSFNYNTDVLYVVGGLDNSGYTSSRMINLKIKDWLPREGRLVYEELEPINYEALQVPSLVPSYFLEGQNEVNLAVIGGVAATVALRFETFKFEPRASFFEVQSKQRFPVLGKKVFDRDDKDFNPLGAYTHVIEIPQPLGSNLRYNIMQKQNRVETGTILLIFGGTSDYIVDAVNKREKFGRPYLYCPGINLIEPIKRVSISQANGTTREVEVLSNKHYPYLNDNSSTFMMEDFEEAGTIVQKLVMRMLIPKRNSEADKENEMAFMLEMVLEQQIEESTIREYEVKCRMES